MKYQEQQSQHLGPTSLPASEQLVSGPLSLLWCGAFLAYHSLLDEFCCRWRTAWRTTTEGGEERREEIKKKALDEEDKEEFDVRIRSLILGEDDVIIKEFDVEG